MRRRRVYEMLAIVGEQWTGPKQKSTGLQFHHLCEHFNDFINPAYFEDTNSLADLLCCGHHCSRILCRTRIIDVIQDGYQRMVGHQFAQRFQSSEPCGTARHSKDRY